MEAGKTNAMLIFSLFQSLFKLGRGGGGWGRGGMMGQPTVTSPLESHSKRRTLSILNLHRKHAHLFTYIKNIRCHFVDLR